MEKNTKAPHTFQIDFLFIGTKHPPPPAGRCSIIITDWCIGGEVGNEEGLYLGKFGAPNKEGLHPVFVIGSGNDVKFDHVAPGAGIFTATHEMLFKAYERKDTKGFQEMFKDAGWMLSRMPHPDFPAYPVGVNFQNGDVAWVTPGVSESRLLVRMDLG